MSQRFATDVMFSPFDILACRRFHTILFIDIPPMSSRATYCRIGRAPSRPAPPGLASFNRTRCSRISSTVRTRAAFTSCVLSKSFASRTTRSGRPNGSRQRGGRHVAHGEGDAEANWGNRRRRHNRIVRNASSAKDTVNCCRCSRGYCMRPIDTGGLDLP